MNFDPAFIVPALAVLGLLAGILFRWRDFEHLQTRCQRNEVACEALSLLYQKMKDSNTTEHVDTRVELVRIREHLKRIEDRLPDRRVDQKKDSY